jgi:hypothetical protein
VNASILMAKQASFNGETSFIGEKYILLAKQEQILAKNLIYWRNRTRYWRKTNYIGDLEIRALFFQILLVIILRLFSHRLLFFEPSFHRINILASCSFR